MIKSNIEKDKIQDISVDLSQSYPTLLLSFATGVGKSLAAIKIIEKNKTKKWYILCKEINHINNWIDEFKKHDKSYLLDNIEIFCYDSLHKYLDTEANLILDEGHGITELRLSQIKTIRAHQIIILSATVTQDKKDLLKQITGNLKEYHISISEAIEKGILPSPKVYLIDVFLDNKIINHENIIYKGLKKERDIIYCNYEDRIKVFNKYKSVELHINCTAKQKYDMLTQEVEYNKKQHFKLQAKWTEFKWLNSGLKRKVFLAEYKTDMAKRILNYLEDKRLVCFTGSIPQCEDLGGKYVVHSKHKDKKYNQKLIDQFNSEKIDKLFAVNMLREGMNLTNIEAGVIVQLDNQKLSFVQMLGRVFRSLLPECFVLVVRNTQDEVYLDTVLDGFNTDYIYKFDKSLLIN